MMMAISRKYLRRMGVVITVSIPVFAGCLPTREIHSGKVFAIAQDESDLVGNWSGESICQDRNSACRDEKNVYHVSKSKNPGIMTISADKIVDGQAVNMGSIDFKYDPESKTLTSENERMVWRFVVKDRTMEGTLTLMPAKRLFRRIMLKKDQ